MALLIDLPPALEHKVKVEAQRWKRTREQIVVDRLTQTFADDGVPTVAEVVARIMATPPNPAMITPPQGDLAEVLRNGPTDPDFDSKSWEQAWATAEGAMKCINCCNSVRTSRSSVFEGCVPHFRDYAGSLVIDARPIPRKWDAPVFEQGFGNRSEDMLHFV